MCIRDSHPHSYRCPPVLATCVVIIDSTGFALQTEQAILETCSIVIVQTLCLTQSCVTTCLYNIVKSNNFFVLYACICVSVLQLYRYMDLVLYWTKYCILIDIHQPLVTVGFITKEQTNSKNYDANVTYMQVTVILI